METYLVLILLAGIVAMDTTSGPQLLISEPIISCLVIGMLFGKPQAGLMLGMFFQLLWLGYMPLGAVSFIDGNMAAFISTTSLFTAEKVFEFTETLSKAAVIPAMFYGVFVGFSGLYLTGIIRRRNSRRSEILLLQLETGEIPSIARWHFVGVGLSFLRGVAMAIVLVPIGTLLFGLLLYFPVILVKGMYLASSIIWGSVAASSIMLYIIKGKKTALIMGFLGGFLWILIHFVQKV